MRFKINLFSYNIVNEFFKYSPSKIISIFIGLISFKFYTKVFSPEEYGILNLILNTFSLITVLLSGWIGYVLIRYFERNKAQNTLPEFLSTLLSFLVLLILLLLIILTFLSFYLKQNLIYLIAIISLPLTIINSLVPIFYQLNQNTFKYNFFNLSSVAGIFLLFLFSYYVFKITLVGFFLSTLIVNFFLLIITVNDFRKLKLKFYINQSLIVEYIKYGLPQVGTGIGVVLLSISSRYFIDFFRGTESVGIFSAAFKFGEMSILLPLGIFTGIFSPYIFRKFELHGKEAAYSSIYRYTILYILIFGPIFIFLFIVPQLPLFLLGSNFKTSLELIPLICFGNFIFGYTQFLALYCQLEYKPVIITISIFCSVVINLFSNYFFIPKYGTNGASYATIIAYISYIFFIVYLSKIQLNNIPIISFLILLCTAFLFYGIKILFLTDELSLLFGLVLGILIWVVLFILMILFKQVQINSFFKYQ